MRLVAFRVCGVIPLTFSQVVTLWYRSPEILLGAKHYSTAVDIWSCGCIFAEMASNQALFQGDSEIDELYKIFRSAHRWAALIVTTDFRYRILGTPTEAEWPGISELPDFKTTFPRWTKKSLRQIVPRLSTAGIDLLTVISLCVPAIMKCVVLMIRCRAWFATTLAAVFLRRLRCAMNTLAKSLLKPEFPCHFPFHMEMLPSSLCGFYQSALYMHFKSFLCFHLCDTWCRYASSHAIFFLLFWGCISICTVLGRQTDHLGKTM